jgi:hypothetical protein
LLSKNSTVSSRPDYSLVKEVCHKTSSSAAAEKVRARTKKRAKVKINDFLINI